MPKPTPTHYEILGVKPNVKHHELTFLFDRRMSSLRREDAAPDQRLETALRNSFAVLSDPDRREAYDRELLAARLKPAFGPAQAAVGVTFVLLVAGGIAWYTLKKQAPAGASGPTLENMAAQASSAVGRLSTTDMSGQSKAAGLAFAIDEGVMIASCEHIAPNTQLSVNLTPRKVAARLTTTDEARGLCLLEAKGAGSWPLRVASQEVRAGDVVYATLVNAVGEVSLKEARVTSVTEGSAGKVVATTITPKVGGAPLLDVTGRVVAVASNSRNVVLPRNWTEAPPPSSAPAPAPSSSSEPAGEAPTASSNAPSPYDRGGVDPTQVKRTLPANSPISQEHAERLHKQYRPERKIPASQDP